jgi:hypothetical protein
VEGEEGRIANWISKPCLVSLYGGHMIFPVSGIQSFPGWGTLTLALLIKIWSLVSFLRSGFRQLGHFTFLFSEEVYEP